MKKYINKIFILLAFSVFLGSCDDRDITTLNSNAVPVATLSASDVVLNPIEEGKEVLTISWNDLDYGYQASANYEVLFDLAGGDFSAPQIKSAGNNLSLTLKTEELNLLLFNLGVTPDTATEINVIVRSVLSGQVGIDSAVQSFTATTYGAAIDPFSLRNMFLVGSGTAADWNPNLNNMPMFRSPDNEDVYTFTGFFLGNELKFVEIKGQWAPQWGTNDGGATMHRRPTEDDPDPSPFTIPADGYYTVSFDLSEDPTSFSMVEYDASGDATYATIGLIGDATPDGWDNDMDMTKSEFDPHIWYINGVTLTNGAAKFRADDDWTNNWGADTAISGEATQNGPDIPVLVAGTYDIWFNDITGNYIFIPIAE